MTNKEKLWKKIVVAYKAEAKKRYEKGDRMYAPYTAGKNYRIDRDSSFKVHFEEASDYEGSWLTVSVSDYKTTVVAEVYDGFGISGSWKYPLETEANHQRPWSITSDELEDLFQEFLDMGEDGFKPEKKPY